MPGNSKVVLDLTYNEVARRLLMHQTPEQISQKMALKLSTLTQMMRRPDFLKVVEKVREKTYGSLDKQLEEDAKSVRQKIVDVQADSFDRLEHLMEHAASEGIQMHIAQDFLDRGGHTKAPEKAPQIQININPIEADVIADALHKEKEGRERLEKLTITLAKPSREVEHPALVRESNDK